MRFHHPLPPAIPVESIPDNLMHRQWMDLGFCETPFDSVFHFRPTHKKLHFDGQLTFGGFDNE